MADTTLRQLGSQLQPHYDTMMLGLDAGRKAKACQGLAAHTAPSTLGGADTIFFPEAWN